MYNIVYVTLGFHLTYFQGNFYFTRSSGDDDGKSATEDEFSSNEEETFDCIETCSTSPSRTQTTSLELFRPDDKDFDLDNDTIKCQALTTPLVPYPSSGNNNDDK